MTHYDNVRIKYAKSNRKNVSANSFSSGNVRLRIFFSENIHSLQEVTSHRDCDRWIYVQQQS